MVRVLVTASSRNFYQKKLIIFRHLEAVYKALNTTIEITLKFSEELRAKFKQLIIQKSKMSILKEDLAGILNTYSEVYHEINEYFCCEAIEANECDPFHVFLGNQNHLSNCFLLLSDHLKDNVKI